MPSTSSTPRKAAIQTITSRSALKPAHPNASENGAAPAKPTSDYFGINTFGWRQMRSKLPKDVYAKLLASIRHGKKLDSEIARDGWYLLPASEELLFRRDSAGMWEELLDLASAHRTRAAATAEPAPRR